MDRTSLHDEIRLIQLTAKGDQQAFGQIFDHYRPVIYTTVLRLSGSSIIAEEIVQDVFLKAWQKKHELPEIKNLGGWLYTIASRLTYNALKQQQRELKTIQEESLEEIPSENYSAHPYHSTEEMLSNEKYLTLLKQAYETLPEKQKKVFRLVRLEGLKRAEVAEALNVSPETVKSNLNEAMIKIRAFIKSNQLLFLFLLSKTFFEK